MGLTVVRKTPYTEIFCGVCHKSLVCDNEPAKFTMRDDTIICDECSKKLTVNKTKPNNEGSEGKMGIIKSQLGDGSEGKMGIIKSQLGDGSEGKMGIIKSQLGDGSEGKMGIIKSQLGDVPDGEDFNNNPILKISREEILTLLDNADDYRLQKGLNNGPTFVLIEAIADGKIRHIKIINGKTNVLKKYRCETCYKLDTCVGPGRSSSDGAEWESFDAADGVNCVECTEKLSRDDKECDLSDDVVIKKFWGTDKLRKDDKECGN